MILRRLPSAQRDYHSLPAHTTQYWQPVVLQNRVEVRLLTGGSGCRGPGEACFYFTEPLVSIRSGFVTTFQQLIQTPQNAS